MTWLEKLTTHATPLVERVVFDADASQRPPDSVRHHLIQSLGAGVEGGNGREDNGADLRGLGHQPQMPEMQGRLPRHEQQRAPLLQLHVRGAGDEIASVAVRNGAEGLDGAGGDDHAQRCEGARGNGRADVIRTIDYIGQGFHLGRSEVGFLGDGDARGSGKNQMGLDVGRAGQHLQHTDAVNLARGAAHGDD